MDELSLQAFFIAFGKVVTGTMLIPIAVGLWQWKYLSKALRIFFVYVCVTFGLFLLEHAFYYFAVTYYTDLKPFLDYWAIQDVNFLSILFQLDDLILLAWFYYLLFPPKQADRILWVTIGLIILVVINYRYIEGYHVFGSVNYTVVAIFVTGVAFGYLYRLYRSQLTLPLTKNPYFWMSLALIIPQLIGLFLLLIGDISHEENYALFITMSLTKNVFLLVSQLLMAVGFWRARYARYVPEATD